VITPANLVGEGCRVGTSQLPPNRAYRDAIGLYAASVGGSVWVAVVQFARLCGADPAGWTREVAPVLAASSGASGAWLLWLIIARSRRTSTRARGLLLPVLAVGVLVLVALADRRSAPGDLAAATLSAWLVREVLLRNGIALNSARALAPLGRSLIGAARVGIGALALFLVITHFMGMLRLYGFGPTLQGDQLSVMGLDTPLTVIAHIVWTAVAEEMVTTGAVAALLTAARRPAWECATVVAFLRLIPHLYLGVPALPTMLMGAGTACLYVRYRRLAPLVVAHFACDVAVCYLIDSITFATWILIEVAVFALAYWALKAPAPSVKQARVDADPEQADPKPEKVR
jgi:hypothetical protein